MSELTHFDAQGQAHMVDVAAKGETHRVARAGGTIRMRPETLALIESGSAKKGDVIGIARIAAIQGAKRTAELVPLCHPIAITRIAVEFEIDRAKSEVHCIAQVETLGRTGVEMEALTAADQPEHRRRHDHHCARSRDPLGVVLGGHVHHVGGALGVDVG